MRANEVSGYTVDSISIINVAFERAEKIDSSADSVPIINIDLENKVTKTIARCKQTVHVDVLTKKGEGIKKLILL